MSDAGVGIFLACLVVALLIAFAAVLYSVSLTAVTFFRGCKRLRFSLRSLMLTVFSGGVCATLLSSPHDSALFPIGVLLTEGFCMFLFIHILGLGAPPRATAAPLQPSEQKEPASPP